MGNRYVHAGIALALALAIIFLIRLWISETVEQQTLQDTIAGPQVQVVVARQPIQRGMVILPDDVELSDWPEELVPDGAFSSVDEIVADSLGRSRYATSDIVPKELLLRSKMTDPTNSSKLSELLSPGFRAVSIRVNDVQGVAGFVFPGDFVDVLLTRSSGCDDDGNRCIIVLLSAVKVLAIDQIALTVPDAPAVVKSVTFELSGEDAQALVLGGSMGDLSLALRDPTATSVDKPEMLLSSSIGTDLDIEPQVYPAEIAVVDTGPETDESGETEESKPESQVIEQPAATHDVNVLHSHTDRWETYTFPR